MFYTVKESSSSYLGLIWRRCLCPAGFCGDTEKKKTTTYNSTLFAVTWHENRFPLSLNLWEYCRQNQIKMKVHEHKAEDSCFLMVPQHWKQGAGALGRNGAHLLKRLLIQNFQDIGTSRSHSKHANKYISSKPTNQIREPEQTSQIKEIEKKKKEKTFDVWWSKYWS